MSLYGWEPSNVDAGMTPPAMTCDHPCAPFCGCEPNLPPELQPEPKWVDLFGIDPDYCDGKPVDEWLDENRGEA